MKIKVNRNILWAETFFNNLTAAGVRFACISPGSRSTPLIFAASRNPRIKSYIHIDERSAAFFATGLARKSKTPVVLICTSGTAVAEFYPGIIEAYQQRIPLIVCTADRPDGSLLRGLNQTINQNNIFANHIRWFYDAGLPDLSQIDHLSEVAALAVNKCKLLQGPVHINFPFEKPFEPDNITDEISDDLIPLEAVIPVSVPPVPKENLENLSEEIISEANGLITVGPSSFSREFRDAVLKLSEITGYPVLADGASQMRFGPDFHPGIITNYDALFRTSYFSKNKPRMIIHFGRTMTSKGYDEFLKTYNGKKFLVNKFNETFDPSGRYNALIPGDEETVINYLSAYLNARGFFRKNSLWAERIKNSESILCELKNNTIASSPFPNEGRIISELVDIIPEDWNLMISNSSPIRDFDYFSGQVSHRINVYHNRGASGIDGITSTALGISALEGKTVLLTGDLAFYHDLNGLLASAHYHIPLIVILINNNGGGIFEALPVAGYDNIFREYFTTPHNLAFKSFIEGYGGVHREIGSWENFRKTFTEGLSQNKLYVMEIKTNAAISLTHRKNYWASAKEALNDNSTI